MLTSTGRSGAGVHVLRLCSVFEPEAAPLDAGAARFDPIGGMQNHTAALTRCLADLGVTQTVITARLAGPTGRSRFAPGATVRRVGVRISRLRQLWGVCAVPYAVRARRPVSLVHAHQGEDIATLLVAMLAAAVHSCPLIVTLHCSVRHTLTGGSFRSWLLRHAGGAVERIALRRAAAVITLVPRTAELLYGDGLTQDRVHVLPSGFDPALFSGPFPDFFPDVPRPRIGYVGRLAQQKRPLTLVEAFGRLRGPAHLILVGDGPLRPAVEEAVRRSPASSRITLTGFVPHGEVPAVLASLDLLVLPSAYEEMGSVLVEALASGLPVVASRVGGIPAVVRHGETGLLVPPGDVAALAAALDELLADPARLQRLAAEARRHASGYSWPKLARHVSELYHRLAAQGEPSVR